MFPELGSAIGELVVMWAMSQQYMPPQLRDHAEWYAHKLASLVDPYVQIAFPEFAGERLKYSKAYVAIQNYLTATAASRARRLKAGSVQDSQSIILSMDDHKEVTDKFMGVKVWWSSDKIASRSMSFSFYPVADEPRHYRLTFHRCHRELITRSYIKHVLMERKAIAVKS